MLLTRTLLHIASALPLSYMVFAFFNRLLGVNPVEKLTELSGIWAIILLLLSLAITPLRRIFKLKQLMRYRRAIGLWAFFYATIHLIIFVVFDHGIDLLALWQDVIKRQFMTVGMLSYLLMVPLVLTSNQYAIKRLKGKWVKLHRLAYAALLGTMVHLIWLTKANDYREIAPYIACGIFLLSVRLYWRLLR